MVAVLKKSERVSPGGRSIPEPLTARMDLSTRKTLHGTNRSFTNLRGLGKLAQFFPFFFAGYKCVLRFSVRVTWGS